MRTLLSLSALFGVICALTCPPQYEQVDGIGCIRTLVHEEWAPLDELLEKGRAECGKDGAHLPIIKNSKDEANLNKYVLDHETATEAYVALDIVCNPNTKRVEWVDGSKIEYPQNLVFPFDRSAFDCVATEDTVSYNPPDPYWVEIHAPYEHITNVYCIYDGLEIPTAQPAAPTTVGPTSGPVSGKCGDYTVMPNSEGNQEPCFKVYADPLSWEAAQKQCEAESASLVSINSADENNFFRRTATSYNLLGGIHIGAHQSTANPSQWTWVDGEVPFDGKAYDNFISAFPIPGAGECAAMLTDSIDGNWINEDCTDNAMPFICRKADYSTVPSICPKDAPPAGEEFYSPGFPKSAIPCQYVLFVAAQKRVELEVLFLVTDGSNDALELFEGPAGSNLIANLIGPISTPIKFTTVKSNVMRVNWKTNGVGSGRGFQIRYNEV